MPRVHMIHAGGAQSLSAQCATPTKCNPVVGNHAVPPQHVPKALPARFMGRSASKGGAMGKLCDDLRVYGCNVNPVKAGTTGGHGQVISRRVIL
jgi:hypothetical protein